MIENIIKNGKLKISTKLVALMLAGTCSFSLVGCNGKGNDNAAAAVKIGVIEEDDNVLLVPGACVAIRNENGNIVEQFFSTEKYHICRSLAPGKYTAEIYIIPDGYTSDFETITFEVTEDDNAIIDLSLIIEKNSNKTVNNNKHYALIKK